MLLDFLRVGPARKPFYPPESGISLYRKTSLTVEGNPLLRGGWHTIPTNITPPNYSRAKLRPEPETAEARCAAGW